jgi:hypothetical protein
MKVLKNEKFNFLPRIPITENDTILLTLRNEINDEILTPNFNFTVNELVEIQIVEDVLTENDKYEIEIKKGADIIYLGKLIILNASVNVQNYNYGQNTNKKFSFR